MQPGAADAATDVASRASPDAPAALSDDDAVHHVHHPHERIVQVVSDGEDDSAVDAVHRTAADVRRERFEAARAALRRKEPARPPARRMLLSSYSCPVCLSAPTNMCVTPCGHVFCGRCLYDTLAAQMKHDGHEWTESDYLGAVGGADAARASGYGSNLFTPFGSTGAMALANAVGVSSVPTRELLNEAVSQRRMQRNAASPPSPGSGAAQAPSASQLRSKNGTQRLRGQCPVCRGPINGGFTGLAKRGILGLEIRLGTPREDAPETKAPDPAAPSPRKRRRSGV